jgi:two-component system, cell cycle response regulator
MPLNTGAHVLSIDSNAQEQEAIRRLLEASGTGVPRRPPFEVAAAASIAEGLSLLSSRSFDVALVSIPASEGDALESVKGLREHFPSLPVVLVLDQDDEKIAVEGASRGVQDCIVRNELVGNLLARSLQYAMERQELQTQIERRSVVDELTGLYNRRGFFALGEQEWKRARRKGDGFHLIYVDLDGLKDLNDRDGHEAGDALLRDTAALLRIIFRDTDILARLGGDEFAVVAHQTGTGTPEAIRDRIDREVERHNQSAAGRRISLSIGIVSYDPSRQPQAGLDELLSQADALMYKDKKRRAGR